MSSDPICFLIIKEHPRANLMPKSLLLLGLLEKNIVVFLQNLSFRKKNI